MAFSVLTNFSRICGFYFKYSKTTKNDYKIQKNNNIEEIKRIISNKSLQELPCNKKLITIKKETKKFIENNIVIRIA